ncbi:hypothetical protein BDR04DRAFT_1094974 [Suillus decipiens]|nr:hypothetical protein BDR04DRAFT_1094974 [Suillus decipiens]
MAAFVRNLTFQTNNLGKESTLLLTFNDLTQSPGVGPREAVVWRVSTFGESGPYQMQVTYKNQLGFTKPQVTNGKIVGAATAVDINVDQQTSLKKNEGGVYSFTTPTTGTPDFVKAVNDAGVKEDLAIGFRAEGQLLPTPVLYFSDVGDASSVTAQFTPKLRAYITSDYQETEILRGEIQSPLVWEMNLATLSVSTTWTLKWDANTGRYSITAA